METDNGRVLWFTGLSGSGKTTTARHVASLLRAEGQRVELLDGDELRAAVCKGLGFSREDRMENVRRIAYIAKLLSRNGVTVLVAAISPYREMREEARRQISEGADFIEIYVKCSLEQCELRDVKGLYAKARRQEITAFTGISDPYEVPTAPDLVIDTERASLVENGEFIMNRIGKAGSRV